MDSCRKNCVVRVMSLLSLGNGFSDSLHSPENKQHQQRSGPDPRASTASSTALEIPELGRCRGPLASRSLVPSSREKSSSRSFEQVDLTHDAPNSHDARLAAYSAELGLPAYSAEIGLPAYSAELGLLAMDLAAVQCLA